MLLRRREEDREGERIVRMKGASLMKEEEGLREVRIGIAAVGL